MMWWNGYGNPGSWWMGLGLLVPLLVLIAVIIGLVYFVRAMTGGIHKPGEKNALDILKERYAKGEISKEDFERIKRDIQ